MPPSVETFHGDGCTQDRALCHAPAALHSFVANHKKSTHSIDQIRIYFLFLYVQCIVNDKIIALSLDSDFKDFEDAIQYYCALESDLRLIITRNQKDFKLSTIPVLSAKEYLGMNG